jgi:hypothetical protein
MQVLKIENCNPTDATAWNASLIVIYTVTSSEAVHASSTDSYHLFYIVCFGFCSH